MHNKFMNLMISPLEQEIANYVPSEDAKRLMRTRLYSDFKDLVAVATEQTYLNKPI